MSKPACADCVHWMERSEDLGICLRFPPTTYLNSKDTTETVWPQTSRVAYCGEWKGWPDRAGRTTKNEKVE